MAENPRSTPGVRAALSIAGSDSSGGAGIQADLRAFSVLRVFGATAITAITAQNTTGVKRAQVLDAELVEAQIDAVAGDLRLHAAKTGMLGSAQNVRVVAKAISRHNLFPLVVDPVMVSRSGDSLIDDAAVSELKRRLIPLAAVVTPNRHEAARLLGASQPVSDLYGATEAARAICRTLGARAVIVKGIRQAQDQTAQAIDVFFDGREAHEIGAEWRDTPHTHGSGCTLSAAIAAALARGDELRSAITVAKALVTESIRQTTDLGHGNSPVNAMAYLDVKA